MNCVYIQQQQHVYLSIYDSSDLQDHIDVSFLLLTRYSLSFSLLKYMWFFAAEGIQYNSICEMTRGCVCVCVYSIIRYSINGSCEREEEEEKGILEF